MLRKAELRQLDTGPFPHEPTDHPDRSELERRFLAVMRRHGLPKPLTQKIVGPYTVDFLWPGQRLIVEVDGWDTHGTRSAFEDDRSRDAHLTSLGFRVVRFTWSQVTSGGPWVARTLRTALTL